MVLYPSLAAEIMGILLDQDQTIPSIEDEIKPQGCTEDAAAQNANIEPFNFAGFEAPVIVCTNNNEIVKIDDSNNDFMSIETIPPANHLNPLVLPDTSDDDDNSSNNKELSDINLSQGGNPGTQREIGADVPDKDPTEDQDQGVH